MHRRRAWFAAVTLLAIGAHTPASAAGIYLKDTTLADRWKAASAAFAGAEYLKVYDSELAQLATYDHNEDLAIARQMTATRDMTVAAVIAGAPGVARPVGYEGDAAIQCQFTQPESAPAGVDPTPRKDRDLLAAVIRCDLDRIAGPAAPGADTTKRTDDMASLAEVMDGWNETLVSEQYMLDLNRSALAAVLPAPAPKPPSKAPRPAAGAGKAEPPEKPKTVDTSCEALAEPLPDDAYSEITDPDIKAKVLGAVDRISKSCRQLAGDRLGPIQYLTANIEPPGTPFPADCWSSKDPLAQVCGDPGISRAPLIASYCTGWTVKPAAVAADKTPKTVDSIAGAADAAATIKDSLTQQISDAKAVNTADQDKLASFGKSLQSVLDQLPTGAAKVEALTQISGVITALSRAAVCNEQSQFDKETIAAATCDKPATPLDAKAQATWEFLNALSMLSDATDKKARSAQWLAAAQAIVAVKKQDAALVAAQQAAKADAGQRRFQALATQVSSEVISLQVLNKTARGDAGARLGCTGTPLACALPLYIEAVNRGAVPAALLDNRVTQLARRYAVQRERAAADRDSQLLKAASDQMQAYVDGGVDPTLILTLLTDAGIVGVLAAK